MGEIVWRGVAVVVVVDCAIVAAVGGRGQSGLLGRRRQALHHGEANGRSDERCLQQQTSGVAQHRQSPGHPWILWKVQITLLVRIVWASLSIDALRQRDFTSARRLVAQIFVRFPAALFDRRLLPLLTKSRLLDTPCNSLNSEAKTTTDSPHLVTPGRPPPGPGRAVVSSLTTTR